MGIRAGAWQLWHTEILTKTHIIYIDIYTTQWLHVIFSDIVTIAFDPNSPNWNREIFTSLGGISNSYLWHFSDIARLCIWTNKILIQSQAKISEVLCDFVTSFYSSTYNAKKTVKSSQGDLNPHLTIMSLFWQLLKEWFDPDPPLVFSDNATEYDVFLDGVPGHQKFFTIYELATRQCIFSRVKLINIQI